MGGIYLDLLARFVQGHLCEEKKEEILAKKTLVILYCAEEHFPSKCQAIIRHSEAQKLGIQDL